VVFKVRSAVTHGKPGSLRAVKALRLATGRSTTVKAWPVPIQMFRDTVVWTSSNPQVARVDPVGRVTAVGPGKAVITARTSGVTARLPVTVR
jgi:uncharacterized protein YjdB